MKAAVSIIVLLIITTSEIVCDIRSHVVKKNDTLYSISLEYDVSVDSLVKANQIDDERALRIGIELFIPFVHEVEKGDTFWSIARLYGTTLVDLLELNKLTEKYILKIGDVLLIAGNSEIEEAKTENRKEVEVVAESVVAEEKAVSERPNQSLGFFWPHEGERAVHDGKNGGTEILGITGDAVITVASGTVVYCAPHRPYGQVIIIEAHDQYMYWYGGNEEALVKPGDRVVAGEQIANLGLNPHTGDARLFFSVYKNGKHVDPLYAPRG